MSVRLPACRWRAVRALALVLATLSAGACVVVPAPSGAGISVADVRRSYESAVPTPGDQVAGQVLDQVPEQVPDQVPDQVPGQVAAEIAPGSAPASVAGIASDPALHVRWGGTIADVRNRADGSTVLEIVSRPLQWSSRPQAGDSTDGRFLAELDLFLDPGVVVAGREITVVGTLNGDRVGTIGELSYRYPVVSVEHYHYWKKVTPARHLSHPRSRRDRHHFHGFFHDWPHVGNPHRRHRAARPSRRWVTDGNSSTGTWQ